nr:immunoglobulin light chain junction region [Macaca mulatta]
CQQYNSFPFTC